METFGNKIQQNSAMKFYCKFCDYGTSRKCNFDSHLNSRRHSQIAELETFGNQIQQKFSEIQHVCDHCKKGFKNRSGLWKHKNKCQEHTPCEKNNRDSVNSDLIMMLIKENSDFKNMIVKVLENGTHITNNNTTTTHTNSHNKAFNLNFFLNETCKNAMNITDFVESIKLQLSDLIEMGDLGYVEGISKIIVKNLNALDETERPIHCTDKKREVFYIKDENKWEKDEEKMRIKKIINKIAYKNQRLLPQYKEKYPDYNDSDSIYSDQYSKIVIEAMGGIGNDDKEKAEKIIRNISKATTICKD